MIEPRRFRGDSTEPGSPAIPSPVTPLSIEVPSLALIHQAAIEKVTLRLAGGEQPRRYHRSSQTLGLVWTVCGMIPLAFITYQWFRHGYWILVPLATGVPSLLKGCSFVRLKPTAQADLD